MYWPYIIISYLSLLALGFVDNLRGPFYLQLLEDLSLSNTAGSVFFTVPSLVAFFTGLGLPKIISTVRILNILRGGLLFIFFGFFVFGHVDSVFELILGGALYGLGFGLVSSTINIGVNQGAVSKYRRMLYSGLHSNYALASLLAPVVVNLFVDAGFSWRETYTYMCFVPLVIMIFSFFYKHKPEENLSKTKLNVGWRGYLMSLALCSYLWMEIGITTRFVLYTQKVHGYDLSKANSYLIYFFILLLAGRLLFTLVRFSVSNYKLMLIANSISSVFLYLGLTYDPIFLVLTGLSFSVVFPVVLDYITNNWKQNANSVMSLSIALGSLSVVLLHFLLGMLADAYGIGTALMICCFSASVLSIVLTITVNQTIKAKL